LTQQVRRSAEVLPQASVILDELGIVEYQVLPDETLQRRRLLVKLAAGAPGLRRLEHRLLALRAEAIEAYDQFDERVQQRKADEQESEQDEFEE